ncbi:hypothetical protein NDN08_006883 [Rhodosorus marinus]|uniref:Prokaryotic-type class I peptide chain release factors domain-containing protein n=1 Tax=Rhodosorus marinus TaxID=101924 RepID=A0AAV8UIZ2_9RHOD|nr:hypothetical protein NDN08_006883 [Rhodosorus marinus]
MISSRIVHFLCSGRGCRRFLSTSATLHQKLELLAKKDADAYEEIQTTMATEGDARKLGDLGSTAGRLKAVASVFQTLENSRNEQKDLEELAKTSNDSEWKEIAEAEMAEWKEKEMLLERELFELMASKLVPGDGTEEAESAIVELRAGTGGAEAALFVEDILNMYIGWSSRHGMSYDIQTSHRGPDGRGFREVRLEIDSNSAWNLLRNEAGVHRVQRVPATEASGRIHTSTMTVSVLPSSLGGVEEVEIKDSDCRVDVFRSSGPGGQHVNTTDTAVRITHRPSGIVVQNQDERSLVRNRALATEQLRQALQQKAVAQAYERIRDERRAQLGFNAGERSDKIRTYNFPQSRITDHRLTGLNINTQLEGILSGGEALDNILSALQNRFREIELEAALEQTK